MRRAGGCSSREGGEVGRHHPVQPVRRGRQERDERLDQRVLGQRHRGPGAPQQRAPRGGDGAGRARLEHGVALGELLRVDGQRGGEGLGDARHDGGVGDGPEEPQRRDPPRRRSGPVGTAAAGRAGSRRRAARGRRRGGPRTRRGRAGCQLPSRPHRYQRPHAPYSHHSRRPHSIRAATWAARSAGWAVCHHGEATSSCTLPSTEANRSPLGPPPVPPGPARPPASSSGE